MTIKTGRCLLCSSGCGLRFQVEDNKIVKVAPDPDNPRSRGYCCAKGLSLNHYLTDCADRLGYPLKLVDGKHVRISWEQALDEIAEKALDIRRRWGPQSFAYMGGGSYGGTFERTSGMALLGLLGSSYYYGPAGQEFLDLFWVEGRLYGTQGPSMESDVEHADTVIAWGWNGMQSHGIIAARKVLRQVAEDPGRTLIVVDPRLSETAELADVHLAIRPGTDALLLKAMVALILEHGWQNDAYLKAHVADWDEVRPWFEGFDARAAVAAAGLDFSTVLQVTERFATTKSVIRRDLGIFMNVLGTESIYLIALLHLLCGRMCVEGGQYFKVGMRGAAPTDERASPRRTAVTSSYPVCGTLPPAIFPEEVLNDHPERLRACFFSGASPVRSYPDSKAMERAIRALELSVCIDIYRSETARCCQYVLPAAAYLESWDSNVFPRESQTVFYQIPGPILEPYSQECRELCQIYYDMADRMGLLPPPPEYLHAAARSGDLDAYDAALTRYLGEAPGSPPAALVVTGTLGRAMGSANKAAIYLLLRGAKPAFWEGAEKQGFRWEEHHRIGAMFQVLVSSPSGVYLSRMRENPFWGVTHPDRKFHVLIPELRRAVAGLTAEGVEEVLRLPPNYPLIFHSGLHVDSNANNIMRNPAWSARYPRRYDLLMSRADADRLGIQDGERVRVVTQASAIEVPVHVTKRAAEGVVYLPHGGGIEYAGTVYGCNANELSKCTLRSERGTPYHRRIPCRVEKL